jgi:hypothetical protein
MLIGNKHAKNPTVGALCRAGVCLLRREPGMIAREQDLMVPTKFRQEYIFGGSTDGGACVRWANY